MTTSSSPADPVVHVIDDDEAVRESLEFLLRTARLKVRTYESAVAFLAALPGIAPGCIVTDVRMPELSGLDLLRELKQRNANLPVIVITGHGDVPLAVEAMKEGAVDFLEKPFADETLMAAIRAALSRHEKDARHDAERAAMLARLDSLSNRERDVLKGLLAGQANKAIAFELGISPRTVEIYRANVMTKTQVSSLSELVRVALTVGFFESPPKI